MNYPEHLFIGIVVAIPLLVYFNTLNLTALAVAAFGALAPDIDHNKSKIFAIVSLALLIAVSLLSYPFFSSRFTAFAFFNSKINVFAVALSLLLGGAAVYIFRIAKPRHRGITHTFLAASVFAALIYLLTSQVGISIIALATYSSHLFADGVIKIV